MQTAFTYKPTTDTCVHRQLAELGVGAGPPGPLYTETVEYSCGVQQVRFKPRLGKAVVSLRPCLFTFQGWLRFTS